MKPKFMKAVIFLIVSLLIFSVNLFAQREVKSTGIGLRVSHWSMSNHGTRIMVTDYGERTSVQTGSGGMYFYLLSRMNQFTLFELSLGAVGNVEEETYHYNNSTVDVFAVTPILLGLRLELISPENQSALHPYLSLGGGPYWFSNVAVREDMYEDEVQIETNLKSGGYAGGGANFLLSDWLAVNIDMKYHFINFNRNHEYSGFELGLGLSFMWGRFR